MNLFAAFSQMFMCLTGMRIIHISDRTSDSFSLFRLTSETQKQQMNQDAFQTSLGCEPAASSQLNSHQTEGVESGRQGRDVDVPRHQGRGRGEGAERD